MLRCVLARLGRVLDLASLFDLPDNHPDRMIAASVALYFGLGFIIGITIGSGLHRQLHSRYTLFPKEPYEYSRH
jgi:hypothetical protein